MDIFICNKFFIHTFGQNDSRKKNIAKYAGKDEV